MLCDDINALGENIQPFVTNPGTDFTRNRKLPFHEVMKFIVAMEKDTLSDELLKYFEYGEDTPTASAFCQQRAKILPEALRELLYRFNRHFVPKLFRGLRILACDGSEFRLPLNQKDKTTYMKPSPTSLIGYNALDVVALYDVLSDRYIDAIIRPFAETNEPRDICQLTDRIKDRSGYRTLIVADRGFATYNFFAHAIERGVYFLARAKDVNVEHMIGKKLKELPDEFDITVHRILTRTNSPRKWKKPENREQYRICKKNNFDFVNESNSEYEMDLRVVRFKISETSYENIVTNLQADFSPKTIKELYAMRWRIETSFRTLKYSIGATTFHSVKYEYVLQEVWARMVLYNFGSEIIKSCKVEANGRRLKYHINISEAMKICRNFLKSIIELDIRTLIEKFNLPERKNREYGRRKRSSRAFSLNYR